MDKTPAYMYPTREVDAEYKRIIAPIKAELTRWQVAYGEMAAAAVGVRIGQKWKVTRAVREPDSTLYECYNVFTISRIAYVTPSYGDDYVNVWIGDSLPPIDGHRLEVILLCEKISDE